MGKELSLFFIGRLPPRLLCTRAVTRSSKHKTLKLATISKIVVGDVNDFTITAARDPGTISRYITHADTSQFRDMLPNIIARNVWLHTFNNNSNNNNDNIMDSGTEVVVWFKLTYLKRNMFT